MTAHCVAAQLPALPDHDRPDQTTGMREECGVFAILRPEAADVARDAYYALYSLQHRGQESCGIVVNDDGVFTNHRDRGIVGDVFTSERLANLGTGEMACGHVRYGTAATGGRINAQPLVVNHIKGVMAIAHNGNLTNAVELRQEQELRGSIFHTTSDTEVIAYEITASRLTSSSIEEAIEKAMPRLEGAYSLVVLSPQKMVGVRDPRGFRPLCIGRLSDGGYTIASESCALDAVGATFVRDVEPGEIVVVDRDNSIDDDDARAERKGPLRIRSIRTHCETKQHAACVFEYIYFARPDSIMDGTSVHEARKRAGEYLAMDHPVDADIVIGVPDSGLDAAMGYSRQSKIPYDTGFIKNKYIGRTFISPHQENRERGVRIKLNPVSSVVKGKRVVLVDDSIVRGTTSARIIKLLHEAGAAEVHMRVSAPPFINPCYYGTDIDSQENLIACRMSEDEIREHIGADTLGYLSVRRARTIAEPDASIKGFCSACFDGNYPTRKPSDQPLDRFRTRISGGQPKDEPARNLSAVKEARK